MRKISPQKPELRGIMFENFRERLHMVQQDFTTGLVCFLTLKREYLRQLLASCDNFP